MNKKICLYIFVALIIVSVVLAAPPWKKQPATATTPKTPPQTVVVQNVTRIIVQNNTAARQEEGIDWNLVGGITAIIALAAGAFGWWFSRKSRGMTAKYLREIDRAFNEFRDNTSKCESVLYDIKEKIEGDFSKGKIDDSAFSILDSRLDKYLSEVRKGIISTHFKLSEVHKKELDDMLGDGIITKDEYRKFKKMKISELSGKDRKRLQELMQKWEKKKE